MQPGVAEKKPVKVTVAGQAFTVLVAGDPADVVRLASEIDEIMHRIATHSGNVDTMRAALLACMHLADRAHTLERELEDIRRRIAEKTETIAGILDGALGPAQLR